VARSAAVRRRANGSVCADPRIRSIVDVPNWVVSYDFPRVVLE
jgi:acetamidase/formamidase